jgi:hypothetical protein
MSSSLYQPLNINGVVSTDKTALQNLNDLCTAAGAFLTFDVSQGKWAVIINTTGTSVKSFSDSNIIGSINVSETGVSELYNTCSLEFPHRDLRDQTDFVEVTIPSGDRYANEVDNTLNIQSNLINDPVQAQYIASVELKQSRLNKIITFTTDYTALGLKAGDLIDVTSTMYGYSSKVFRVTKLEEVDEEGININITALEYDADIYSTSGLVAVEKTKKTGIQLKESNETIKELDDASVAGSIGRMIAANVGLGIANTLLNKLFGRKQAVDANGNPIYDANGNPIYSKQTKPADKSAEELDKVLAGAKKPALTTISAASSMCEGATKTITAGHTCSVCLFTIPPLDYDYEITGISEGDIDIPLTGVVTVTNGSGTLTFTASEDFVSEGSGNEVATINIGGKTTTVTIWDKVDYALVSATRNNPSITEGGSVIVTLTATGTKANATIPYVISGTATGKVASPSLTGTVTTSSGTATLTISTTDDSEYTGTQGLTITFGTSTGNPCTTDVVSTSVTVLDNDTAPPTPPADTTCSYVSVPAVWCGQFDGTTNVLKGITVRKYVMLPVPQAGEATVFVPYECAVSGGAITVVEEIEVAAASVSCGGFPVRIITSFNSVPNKGIITGTTTTLYGY